MDRKGRLACLMEIVGPVSIDMDVVVSYKTGERLPAEDAEL